MHRRIMVSMLVGLFLLSAPSMFANDCQSYICEQRVTVDGASDPYCAETVSGVWIECRVMRYCIYVVGDNGHMTKQCTATDCEGEGCLWI